MLVAVLAFVLSAIFDGWIHKTSYQKSRADQNSGDQHHESLRTAWLLAAGVGLQSLSNLYFVGLANGQ